MNGDLPVSTEVLGVRPEKLHCWRSSTVFKDYNLIPSLDFHILQLTLKFGSIFMFVTGGFHSLVLTVYGELQRDLYLATIFNLVLIYNRSQYYLLWSSIIPFQMSCALKLFKEEVVKLLPHLVYFDNDTVSCILVALHLFPSYQRKVLTGRLIPAYPCFQTRNREEESFQKWNAK